MAFLLEALDKRERTLYIVIRTLLVPQNGRIRRAPVYRWKWSKDRKMDVSGLQKLTLLDYPGRVACTIFTGGCDLRCPFCHNASLALPERERDVITHDELMAFLNDPKNAFSTSGQVGPKSEDTGKEENAHEEN